MIIFKVIVTEIRFLQNFKRSTLVRSAKGCLRVKEAALAFILQNYRAAASQVPTRCPRGADKLLR